MNKRRFLLIQFLFFLLNQNLISQNSLWISELDYSSSQKEKSNADSNRFLIKYSKDSLFFFDTGKEDLKQKFSVDIRLEKEKNSQFFISQNGEKNNVFFKENSIMQFQSELRVFQFRKLKTTKFKTKKIEKLLNGNRFLISPFKMYNYSHKIRTEITLVKKNKDYISESIEYELLEINGTHFLKMRFYGNNLYPISNLNRKKITLINYASVPNKISLTKIKK